MYSKILWCIFFMVHGDAPWKTFGQQWPKTTLLSHIPGWVLLVTRTCCMLVLEKVKFKIFRQEGDPCPLGLKHGLYLAWSAASHCLLSLITMFMTLSAFLGLKNSRRRKGRGKCSPHLFCFHTTVTEKQSFHCLIPQAHFPALNQTNRNLVAFQTSLFFRRYILVPSWQSFTYCLKYTTRCVMAFLQPWIVLWDLATYTEQ